MLKASAACAFERFKRPILLSLRGLGFCIMGIACRLSCSGLIKVIPRNCLDGTTWWACLYQPPPVAFFVSVSPFDGRSGFCILHCVVSVSEMVESFRVFVFSVDENHFAKLSGWYCGMPFSRPPAVRSLPESASYCSGRLGFSLRFLSVSWISASIAALAPLPPIVSCGFPPFHSLHRLRRQPPFPAKPQSSFLWGGYLNLWEAMPGTVGGSRSHISAIQTFGQ